jgi:ribonucleotide reductase beta subunit family protein with ferritin-like domain
MGLGLDKLNNEGVKFKTMKGIGQGDMPSPLFWVAVLDTLLTGLREIQSGFKLQDIKGNTFPMNEVAFADDLQTVAATAEELERKADVVSGWCQLTSIKISHGKMRTYGVHWGAHRGENPPLKVHSLGWIPEEVDTTKDLKDYKALTPNERHFINRILGFFAGSDGIVNENLAANFANEVQWPEAKAFYTEQMSNETVHSETYSRLIDAYIDDKAEKLDTLRSIRTMPFVEKKANWAMHWMNGSDADFATRLMAFAAVEGIFFSGAFCSIFWFKQRGILPGLTTSNEFISRDEGLHTDFAVLLYSKLEKKLSKTRAHKLIREAVKIEKEFIIEAIPCAMIGMNSKLMTQYIEYVADRLLVQLGYPKTYEAVNPFAFMERISLEGKDNFFEKRVSSYALAGVGKTAEQMSFSMTADF